MKRLINEMALRWSFSIGKNRETWKTWHAEAHVITDGLAAPEARLMPLLGSLTKALREANFPTLIAQKADWKLCRGVELFFCFANGWQMASTDFEPGNRSSVKKADGHVVPQQ